MKTVLSICLTFSLAWLFYQAPAPSIEIVKIGTPEVDTRLRLVNDAEIFLVNMIPNEQSDEFGQDSEPFLAVHPDQELMIGSAYYGDSVRGGKPPPLFLSTDGGKRWQLISIIPAARVESQTYCFSGNGKSFYGAIATSGGEAGKAVSVFHTSDPAAQQPLQRKSTLSSGSQLADEPFVQTLAFPMVENEKKEGSEAAKRVDRVYVGHNYFGPPLDTGKTASVQVSLDGEKFKLFGLETRSTKTAGQDGPSVRPTIAKDGTVYVAFFHWTSQIGTKYAGDVVVTRDDEGAAGTNSFQSLTDPSDGLPGRLVASNRLFPFGDHLGKQVIGSPLSLAVDPNHSGTLYLAWADFDQPLKKVVIHLKRSTDRGQTWSADVLTIPSATNPALAISNEGAVGLLYQQLQGLQQAQRWETHFQKSPDGVGAWTDFTLSTFPTSIDPPWAYDPYLGYKVHLLAVENNFYGVFSAPNAPEQKYFPQGVEFQREYQNGKLFSKDGSKEIGVSIDPYFFKIYGPKAIPSPTPLDSDGNNTAASLKAFPSWPIALLGLFVAAGFAATVWSAYRARKKVNTRAIKVARRAIDQRIQGPALSNYEGFLTARFTDSSGETIQEIEPAASCNLIVEFAKKEPREPWAERILLQGGEDTPLVTFRVAIDTIDFNVDRDHDTVSVAADGSQAVTFSVVAPPKLGEHAIFIQVFQKTRLVQVVAPKISVSE